MRLSPCKGCTKRETGCHSKCEEYTLWKREHDESRKVVNNEREYVNYRASVTLRLKKRK